MSLTQLGGESGGQDVTSYPIYQQISRKIAPKIKEEIKKLLQKKITPIKDHLKSLIYNPKTYLLQDAAKFSNVIKEKLFAVPPNENYKKYPSITSGRLLELLTRVKPGNDKFVVFDVYDADGFVVTQEDDTLKYNTGINIAKFIKTYDWTNKKDLGNFIFGSLITEKPETERRQQIIEKINDKKTENNKEIMVMVDAYMEEITQKIEEKFQEIEVPTDISENDAQQQFSAAIDVVVENENENENKNGPKSTTGGQRRNRKSKKARKTKKARKSRKNRRKSNRRRR